MRRRASMRQRVQLSARAALAWRPTGRRLVALLRSMLVSYTALGVTLYIVPGRQSSGPLALLGLVVAVAGTGVLLRPLLVGLATVLGSFGLLLLGVVAQAIILDVAIALAPDVDITGQPEVLVISWVAASLAAVVNWLLDAGGEDAFLNQLLGRAVQVAHQRRSSGVGAGGGLLVIQLDGVGEELFHEAIRAGSLPTFDRWLRSRSHTLDRWHTGLPATTPAGQAVLLHGDVSEVPSFRWYEKETGRLMVANHPRDAAEIQRRISDGDGLLASGGVSVSNLFSGDAPTRFLTMSDAHLPTPQSRGLALFAARGGFARAAVLSVGTMITELYQGRRQHWRDVQPRVHRGGLFALQRAVTTVLLRDLTIAIVTEQIARGTPAIFADFVDFDEVAHHAGPSRPESMRTLDGLDRIVAFLAEVSHQTGQLYEIAVVSDHGQAQGATFAQLAGLTLTEVVARLCAEPGADPDAVPPAVAGADSDPVERWGPTNLLLSEAARSAGVGARALRRTRIGTSPGVDGEITHGGAGLSRAVAGAENGVIVAAAGSLAHVYLPALPGRATREEVDRYFPRLIDGLARHPHIGTVLVRSAALGAIVALGAHGWRVLTAAGPVGGDGTDPIAGFGPHACADLIALDGRRHVGDIVVLARVDPETGAVAAFEDLVGSHGGLGGGQTEAFLLRPSDWLIPNGRPLHGLDVHQALRAHVPARVTHRTAT